LRRRWRHIRHAKYRARNSVDTEIASNGEMDPDQSRRMPRPGVCRKPISLALQGGGSWGAYTWGVLEALLASRSVVVTQLSGTSAGAINAAIVASALAKGSPARARHALQSFWLSIAADASVDLVSRLWAPLQRRWTDSMSDWLHVYGAPPTHAANPFAADLLRNAIDRSVDIDAIRSNSAPALFVTATNVRTGLPRVFSNASMSVDVLLASACLPELFPAVEIDGESYWDGAYGGNPTLWPMIDSGLAADLIVIQLLRDRVGQVPIDARAIRRRVSEIVFNSSLVAEMQAINAIRAKGGSSNGMSSLGDVRLHRIGPPSDKLSELGSGVERARIWLQQLHDEGVAAGRGFMARHGADIGVRETLDIGRAFVDAHNRTSSKSAMREAFVPNDASPEISQTVRHEPKLRHVA